MVSEYAKDNLATGSSLLYSGHHKSSSAANKSDCGCLHLLHIATGEYQCIRGEDALTSVSPPPVHLQ